MSVFNVNLELAAPECSIPDLQYEVKWFFVMGLPVAAATLFLLAHIAVYLKKKCILRTNKKLHAHGSALIGMTLILFYYLYLYLTRTILDVFNCSPTDPPDGHEYLEVVFVPCGEEGGLQLFLMPFAVVLFLVYSVAFPIFLFFLLHNNRHTIMEDQILRANHLGDRKMENPNAFELRKRLHKLYYHFKPWYSFWKIIIIGRKFLVAFSSLMFRKNPSFQLAVVLLVLMCSYALQVKYNPYMSMSETDKILKEHKLLAEAGHPIHQRIRSTVDNIVAQHKKYNRGGMARWTSGKKTTKVRASDYIFDYNTVESTLLFSAVLVTLAGIMFESGQLDSADYDVQRDLITLLVLIVIFVSVMYFFAVFATEIYAVLGCCSGNKKQAAGGEEEPAGMGKRMSRALSGGLSRSGSMKDAIELARRKSKQQAAVRTAQLESSHSAHMNPMFLRTEGADGPSVGATSMEVLDSGSLPTPSQWEVVRHGYKGLQSENADLKRAKQELEMKNHVLEQERAKSRAGRTGGGGRRREFAPTQSGATVKRGSRKKLSMSGSESDVAGAGGKKRLRKKKSRRRSSAALPSEPPPPPPAAT